MKGKPTEQSQLFRDIVEAKETYLHHNILPELLKWLEQATVSEIQSALDIYMDVIMGMKTRASQLRIGSSNGYLKHKKVMGKQCGASAKIALTFCTKSPHSR